jgi:predicted phage replisome organizer
MAEVKWIKIVTDIFDDEKILLIESMPDKYAIIVCWFKLLCLAGKQNNSGVFMMNNRIAYTDEMLATIFRMPLPTVRMSLQAFEQFGMVEIIDGVITIPNWGRHQSLDAYEKKKAYDRQYRLAQREKQKLLAEKSNDCQTSSRTTVVVPEEDKEEDKEIDIEEDKKISCQQIVDLYHSICKSYPKVRSLSDARRKAINARLKAYSLEDFRTVFENAENSSFLKGSNDRNWSANFDWLIADKNIAKVLEGNYADRGRKEAIPKWMNKPRELDDDEVAAIQRLMNEPTDPALAERAEKLRQSLQEGV